MGYTTKQKNNFYLVNVMRVLHYYMNNEDISLLFVPLLKHHSP